MPAMTVNLTAPIFTDEDKARAYFEEIRWPNGVTCPHCGNANSARIYSIAANAAKKIRVGLRECQDCHGQFTVRTGGVMESSHVPLTKWALAYRLMTSGKKGFSAHQLHRTLGVSYKTAWFMAHRIRESMRPIAVEPMGGEGKFVEADETFVGGKAKNRAYAKTLPPHEAVMSLVERGGKVRSRHVADVSAKTLKPILVEAIAEDSHFRTDQAPVYTEIGTGFASHETVNHSIKEYVRGDAHTNTVEGYFSIFKRGIYGTYHHVSTEHLKRYLCEFDFRYNERIALGVDDTERTVKAIRGAEGRRLTYRQPRGAQQASS
jgi:transposase-like protein